MIMIKSALRYPGGKSRAIKQIEEQLPESFSEYREPFLGGGSVLLYIRQNFPEVKCWVNDLYSELYYFWVCARDCNDTLVSNVREIRDTCKDGKALYQEMKRVNTADLTPIDRAARFFILNRITFSGCGESGGFSPYAYQHRFTDSSIERLINIQPLLEGVRITDWDYSYLLSVPGDNVLCFLDPPYYTATKYKLYGKGGNLHSSFNHDRFFRDVTDCKHKVLITYDDCEKINSLCEGLIVKEWDLKYSMRHYNKGKELFIKNYE